MNRPAFYKLFGRYSTRLISAFLFLRKKAQFPSRLNIVLLVGLLSACGVPAPQPTATPLPTATSVPATATPIPPTATFTASPLPPTETITPLPSDTPTPTGPQTVALVDIPAQQGGFVWVKGVVVDMNSFSAGFKFTLDDGTGQLAMVLFQDTYAAVAGIEDLRLGAEVLAQGEIGTFNDEIQMVPKTAEDVQILQAGQTQLQPVPIADITLTDSGQLLTVEGQVRGFDYFSLGARMQVKDDTGSIDVVLWQNVLDFVPEAKNLISGPQIRLTGKIGEYRGRLQIVPQIGFDVVQMP
jgi:DNA/RNA endonuclease YhcR with UshA esterase domain